MFWGLRWSDEIRFLHDLIYKTKPTTVRLVNNPVTPISSFQDVQEQPLKLPFNLRGADKYLLEHNITWLDCDLDGTGKFPAEQGHTRTQYRPGDGWPGWGRFPSPGSCGPLEPAPVLLFWCCRLSLDPPTRIVKTCNKILYINTNLQAGCQAIHDCVKTSVTLSNMASHPDME